MIRDTHFPYVVVVLAVIGIFSVFISYATDMLPIHTSKQRTPLATSSRVVKKKSCACCTKTTVQDLEILRQNRQKRLAHQQRYTQATDLITQYGLEEGIRKLKQSDPEIAAQFERFLVEHPADSKNARSSP